MSVIPVLLIEDSPGYTRLIRELLAQASGSTFQVETAEDLAEGLARLERGGIRVVLLDLSLPDSQGLETVERVRTHAPQIPIVVLTDLNDEELAVSAVQRGAQDYMLKRKVDGEMLARAIRYAIERKLAYQKIQEAEEQLKSSYEQLRALSAHLQSAREEERMNIAREIHDEVGQTLSALKMDVMILGRRLAGESEPANKEETRAEIEAISSLIDEMVASIRKVLMQLRPELLDELGLAAAIEWQAQEFGRRTGIACEVASLAGPLELGADRSIALFRILQEALTNVSRHAEADRVRVALRRQEDKFCLEVKDNGRGIREEELAKANHFGILGMRERVILLGGELEIHGRPGEGTTVRVQVPLE